MRMRRFDFGAHLERREGGQEGGALGRIFEIWGAFGHRQNNALPAVLRLSALASQGELASWPAGWSCATFWRIVFLHWSNEILTFLNGSMISKCSGILKCEQNSINTI